MKTRPFTLAKPATLKPSRTVAVLAILIAATLATLSPRASAVNSEWTREVVSPLTDTITQGRLAHDGERLGMVYKYRGTGTNGLVGFAIRAADGTWTQKSADISGLGLTTLQYPSLIQLAPATWDVLVQDSNGPVVKVYRSTTDGATWTLAFTDATCTSLADITRMAGSNVGYLCNGFFRLSSDLGATFGAAVNVCDNAGSNGETATAGIQYCNGKGALYWTGSSLTALMSGAGDCRSSAGCNTVEMASTDNAATFWTVPFGSPCPTDLGSSMCAIFTDTGCGIACGTPVAGLTMTGAGGPIVAMNTYHYGLRVFTPSNLFPLTASTTPTAGTISGVSETPFVACTTPGTSGSSDHVAVSSNAASLYLFAGICTNPAGLQVNIKNGPTGTWGTTFQDATVTGSQVILVDQTASKSFVVYTNSALGNRVELVWSATPTVKPDASAGLAGLVGFAVDPFDQGAIARLSNGTGGQSVVALDPSSLRTIATMREPNCNRLGGVATRYTSGREFTTFLDCDTSNNVNTLHVRDGSLQAPDYTGTPCAGESFCDMDVTTMLPSNARDLGRIEAAPWDYTLGSTEPTCGPCVKHVTLAWAYSEISGGHVGVYALTMNKNAADVAATVAQPFAPAGSVIQDFCAWRDTQTKKDYLAAVRSDGPTKIYQASVTEQLDGTTHKPIVALNLLFAGGGGFDNAVALGCARNHVLVVTADGHAVLANVQGQTLATFPAPGPMQHGGAMSLDGAFGVIGSNNVYHLLDLVNRTDVLTTQVPTGNLYYTGLDFNAKILWSATSAGPYKYLIGAALRTQGVPAGSNRDLVNGTLLPCTDAQGNPSSTCSGAPDPAPGGTGTGGTGTGTGTGSGTGTTAGTSTGTGTGTQSTTGTNSGTQNSGTDTGSSGTSTSSTNGSADGGGDGAITSPSLVGAAWVAAILLAVGLVAAVAVRSRLKGRSGP